MSTTTSEFRQRWIRLWPAHAAPDCAFLLQRYAEGFRHYHNADHIVSCLQQLDAVPGFDLASRPNVLLQLAIFFHDAIYDPRAKDNELQSAALAQETLAPTLPATDVQHLTRLILATDHRHPPATPDEALIVDADLSILGQPQAAFDVYESAIRAEYHFVPDEQFRTGRAAVLRHFLARPTIFSTPFFHQQYEQPARVNLTRSLSRLATV